MYLLSSASRSARYWAIRLSISSGTDGPAVLYAYDALNLSTQLYRGDTTIGAANAAGNAVKFGVPVVANGKVYVVYVGTQTELTVFGLLP
jgi:hypothetical protein